jgi:hypothetical protein
MLYAPSVAKIPKNQVHPGVSSVRLDHVTPERREVRQQAPPMTLVKLLRSLEHLQKVMAKEFKEELCNGKE